MFKHKMSPTNPNKAIQWTYHSLSLFTKKGKRKIVV